MVVIRIKLIKLMFIIKKLFKIYIPMYPVNFNLVNMCYLILHNPREEKKSHMSVLIDIGGNSTEENIIGLMIHLTTDMNDGLCPHSTKLKCDLHQMDRVSVQIINLGNISQSKYVYHPTTIPIYLHSIIHNFLLSLICKIFCFFCRK